MFDISELFIDIFSMPLFNYVGVGFAFAMLFTIFKRWFL